MRFLSVLFICFQSVLSQNVCDTIYQRRVGECFESRLQTIVPMPEDAKIIHLDFGCRRVCAIDQTQRRELIDQGFSELKSDFHRRGFAIYVQIRRKEYKFEFDVGFQESFSMKADDRIAFLKEAHEAEHGSQEKDVYNNKWVTLGGVHFSSAVTVSSQEDLSRVGLGFISGFDWIVDRANHKVYFKKNGVQISSQNQITRMYRTKIVGEKLVIDAKNVRFNKFRVGDEIISVNGIAVSGDNLCEMALMLSERADWNLLDVRLAPNTVETLPGNRTNP